MRVLQFNSLFSGGGTDEQVLHLSRALCQSGISVCLTAPHGAAMLTRAQATGAEIALLPRHKLRAALALARLIRSWQPDIVHAHHGRDYWPVVLACKLAGSRAPLILSRHLAKSPGSWLSRHCLLDHCDAFIAVSNFVAHILKHGAAEPEHPLRERQLRPPMRGDHNKIHVIYPGIDLDAFSPRPAHDQRHAWGLNGEQFAFGVVGAYNFPVGKGQREFLEAAARIHHTLPQARFLLLGRGNMAEYLDQEIVRLGLASKAWRTPWCNEMPLAMNALDCVVHPAIGTEAFGLVVVEAFACGKPVIANALDGVTEAFELGNSGRLLTQFTVDQLAEAMLAIALEKRPSQVPDLSRVALPTLAREHLSLYERCLASRRSSR